MPRVSIAPGLRSWIETQVTEVAALGRHAVDISRIPQTVKLPAVTVNKAGMDRNQTLDGTDESLVFEDFELRVWSITGKEADDLLEAIIEALDDFVGNMGSDRKCEAVILGDETLDVSEFDFGDEIARHVAAAAVTIQHSPQ